MSALPTIQSLFLEAVKSKVPPNISFAEDLSETLRISRDSAYRRIRGETILTLDEVKELCNHYQISLDSLMAPTSNTVTFHHRMIGHDNFGFDKWLKSILDNLEMMHSFPEKELIYQAKDLPIFHYFTFPELTAFKIYFWNKTVLTTDYANEKFHPDIVPKEIMSVAKRVHERYSLLPSTEIWCEETAHITLRQIEFHYECGFFTDPADVSIILDQCLELLRIARNWAARGDKGSAESKYNLYRNDILIPDTGIFFKTGNRRVAYTTVNTLDLLTTSNEVFCKQAEKYLANLLTRAVLISTTGEKERSKFFNSMESKVQALRQRLT
ncbi:MAG TPA: helix-turn-helix transcriptional regulator [Cyclobacteriaceae bacterium]|nr:helix-turn-helix transcriptional regulator [Cyclobacteriaceae bacterium]